MTNTNTTKPPTAEDEWNTFSEMVGINAPDVPENQRNDLRGAFYAGQFQALCFLLTHVGGAPGDVQDGMLLIESRWQEVESHLLKHVKELRAVDAAQKGGR